MTYVSVNHVNVSRSDPFQVGLRRPEPCDRGASIFNIRSRSAFDGSRHCYAGRFFTRRQIGTPLLCYWRGFGRLQMQVHDGGWLAKNRRPPYLAGIDATILIASKRWLLKLCGDSPQARLQSGSLEKYLFLLALAR